MGILKQKTVIVNSDAVNAINVSQKAISQCGWKVINMGSSTIKATTGISIWSWGETVLVQVQVSEGLTYLNVQSKSKDMVLLDWGKNQENVDKFLNYLSRHVQLNEP